LSYTSFGFLIFVLITTCVYFLFPVKKYQWTVLLAASYIFYLFAGYRYAAFLLITTLSTYGAAMAVDAIAKKAKQVLKEHKTEWDKDQKKAYKNKIKAKKRAIMLTSVILNLGILFVLKYYNFLAGSINDMLGGWGIAFSAPMMKLMLPLGISFYTFQSVGYLVDVYNEKIQAEKNPAKFALFVSYFPQIIQGPISFYDQLASQLYEPHRLEFTRFKHGCELILWGLFKKMVIADRAIVFINAVVDQYTAYNGTMVTMAVLMYALQLYADFSGGIDISRGVSQILGIELTQNFRRPYFATTINDYWRRWHISLGAWMKEYVFYPLALSRGFTNVSKKISASKFGKTRTGAHVAKVLPTSFASLVVFLLVGIWHGANWKFVAFGLWNGVIIMLSTLLEPAFEAVNVKLKINTKALWFRVFQMFRTFLIVCIGYVFDIAKDFAHAMGLFWSMLTRQNPIGYIKSPYLDEFMLDHYVLIGLCTLFLFVISCIQERHSDTSLRVMLDRKPFILRYCMLFVGILMLMIFGIYGPDVNVADFVYMQF